MASTDLVDATVATQMRKQGITGLSLAIIQDGEIVKEKGYGFTDRSGKTPMTRGTLFQAGSISKSVAATGVLHLVEQDQLSLDTDINEYLRSWKVPENDLTKEKKVTLRSILTHTAGLTVHGFPGYSVHECRPTLVQVLEGIEPANTPAVRVDILPEKECRYSGGGYTVMQQMLIDVSGIPMPQFMHDTVLMPFGMTSSSYQQPPAPEMVSQTAAGHLANGEAVDGRWHIYPEMAAAGLWTTASDLARFAIGIQQATTNHSTPVISQAMAHMMLGENKGSPGLGVFLEPRNGELTFLHNGRNEGFDAFMIGFVSTRQGAVIMINANDDSGAIAEILKIVAEEYDWA